jgi:hydrogenase maturation protease
MIGESGRSLLILGIGNEILTDDGIGPRLVNDLDRKHFHSGVSFQQSTLGGLELLDIMRDFTMVIIIDALKTGRKHPGFIYHFTPKDFEETLHLSNLHDINFLTALELGRKTGMKIPDDIHIIAVEIIEDMVFSSTFSPEIAKRYPVILQKVEDTLKYLTRDFKEKDNRKII